MKATRRDFVAFSLALVMTPPWTGCSRSTPGAAPVRLAKRVISLSPATTEALFAIGAGSQVVGRSRFCDFPPEARALPAVGGYVDADFEAILELAPDLVVGAPGPNSDRLGDKLSRRGIATWFPSIDSIASIEAMLLGLGERTGHAGGARRVEDDVEKHTVQVERAVAREPAPRVLMVLGTAPVVAAGPKSFLDELIARARATNVVTDGAPWQTLELEHVIELDPDVVLDASDYGANKAGLIGPDAPGWSHVRAVRTGRVLALHDPRVLRPGPRVAEGLAVLAQTLHPNVPAVSFSR